MTGHSLGHLLLTLQLVLGLAASSSLPFPVPSSPSSSGKVCTVNPLGCRKDDTPQILKAFEDCNNGGTVVFPEGKIFYIASRMNPIVYDVTVEWRGLWQVRLPSSAHQQCRACYGCCELTWKKVLRQPRLLAQQLLPDLLPEPRCRVCLQRGEDKYQWLWHGRDQRQRQHVV